VGLAAVVVDGRTGSCERHRPETTALYAVVRNNVETPYAAVAAGFDGAAPLGCGLLCRVSLASSVLCFRFQRPIHIGKALQDAAIDEGLHVPQ